MTTPAAPGNPGQHGPLLVIALIACLTLLGWLGRLLSQQADRPSSPRIDWSAIAPDAASDERPWRSIVIHHSGADRGDSQGIDHSHLSDNKWDGIGYHFVIGNGHGMPLGQIDATWRWYRQNHGAHAGEAHHNEVGIGICLIGDYERQVLPPLMLERCAHLCALLQSHYRTIDAVIGHRHIKATACPGARFPMARLHARIAELLPHYQQKRPPDDASTPAQAPRPPE